MGQTQITGEVASMFSIRKILLGDLKPGIRWSDGRYREKKKTSFIS